MIGKFLLWLKERIKYWIKPATSVLIIGILLDLTRNRTDLVVENALLRQQLIVLKRQIKRPLLTNPDRFRLVFLSHFTKFWKQALHIVQRDTLLRWHRELFQFYWRRKSQGKPKITPETIALIQEMVKENRLWGAERIRDELLKLGIEVSKRTVQRYMPKEKKTGTSSQIWATFLKNQASGIWACDFTVVYDWLFRQWYVFVVMELKTRRIVHMGVTKYPTDKWTAQQLREATPWGKGPKYLIRDRIHDDKHLRRVVTDTRHTSIRNDRIKGPISEFPISMTYKIEANERAGLIEGNPWGTASQLFAYDVSELTYIFAGQELNDPGCILFTKDQDMKSNCI